MIASELAIRSGAPSDDADRDAFVRSHPHGSFFHLSGWRRVVERVFRHESWDLVAERGGELVGVLPLMSTPGFFGSLNLVSVPYGVYGGPLGADPAVEQALLEAAVRKAEIGRVGYLELRYRRDPGPDLVGTSLYATFVRDLPDEPEEVLARMPKKARAEARKARDRHGLDLREGSWYVDDLYRLFLRNKHGLGSPALPAKMFKELLVEFGDDVYVHIVRREREPVAAVMSFAYGDTLLAYYSGTELGADRVCSASNFMYLALQEWAVERGFEVFDFGRSRTDSGAYRFKQHQGFEPTPLHYRYHLVRQRRIPSFTPSNPRMRVFQKTWRQLPLWMARRLSNSLAQYLP